MFLSVFEIFKIGVGPSSSHTMGPMTAANRFLADLLGGKSREPGAGAPAAIEARLHGSLAFTGKGHATDRAVILGLLGLSPDTLDPDAVDGLIAQVAETKRVAPGAPYDALGALRFDLETDLVFDYGQAPQGHPNALRLVARDAAGTLVMEEVYFSIGGGFVLDAAEMAARQEGPLGVVPPADETPAPYPFRTAQEMLQMGAAADLPIAQMKRANERARLGLSDAGLDARLDKIWSAMAACVARGLSREGELPGGLQVRRRAKAIRDKLTAEAGRNDAPPHKINDWIGLYAMAVNEENAAGGRVVTSPTNGAAGVAPAVLSYFVKHVPEAGLEQPKKIRDFLLTAAAIGGLIKENASISGAEVGCQGEVGSAAAMAAAGLCAVLGGTNAQIENAAEIALEHHLGMTCDPVAGLVQVPCIERNALGAVKAVAAASMALNGDGQHFMPLDNCIEAMRQTGLDMSERYKETSQGGLAVTAPNC